MKLLGVTFNICDPFKNLSYLGLYGFFQKSEIDLVQLADVDLMESYLELHENERYERVVIFTIDELEDWHELRELTNVCDEYNMEYSFIKEDLHSDKEVKIGELTGVI